MPDRIYIKYIILRSRFDKLSKIQHFPTGLNNRIQFSINFINSTLLEKPNLKSNELVFPNCFSYKIIHMNTNYTDQWTTSNFM